MKDASPSLATRLFSQIDWGDWRVRWVLASVALALASTVAIYAFVPKATDATRFEGALFASWVSGLMLFILTGAVVTIVSLARPDKELFEARARNLLRRQSGPHIDYIIESLNTVLEPYVDVASKKITITDYDDEEKKFHTAHTTKNIMRSYLDDIPMSFPTHLRYINAALQPPGRMRSCLTYLRVNGEPVGDAEEFDTSVERGFRVSVPRHGTCSVEHRLTYWLKAIDEPNTHTALRFTRRLSVELENQLPVKSIVATVSIGGGAQVKIPIAPGETQMIVHVLETRPGENVYDFRLAIA